MDKCEKEMLIFGIPINIFKADRRYRIEDIVEKNCEIIKNYFCDKLGDAVDSPVSRKKIQLKMRSLKLADKMMDSFEDTIQKIEARDDEVFDIPDNINLAPKTKFSLQEADRLEEQVKALEQRYKQNTGFLYFLRKEKDIFDELEDIIEQDRKTKENLDQHMKSLDISQIEDSFRMLNDK